jgi:hypothetical protein
MIDKGGNFAHNWTGQSEELLKFDLIDIIFFLSSG